mmetsp:Transcript_74400/g.195176  ORF Transcript_74400/g.195176 Transcript_74400/m.195176 type:complete len:797 (-) Transcript_74400:114-2504(-)
MVTTGELDQVASKDKRQWTVPRDYKVPRKPVARSFEALDALDCPERPGMVYEITLRAMITRFDAVFGDKSEMSLKWRETQVEDVLDHMRRHTRRRRGDSLINEGFIEWEQTSRVYELFAVQLNIFERIFFTVDVSETTSVLSTMVSTFLVLMIFVSMLCWMVSTLPYAPFRLIPAGCVGVNPGECAPKPAVEFLWIEQISVIVFTLEYLVRLMTVHSVRFELLNEHFLEDVLSGGEIAAAQGSAGGSVNGLRSLMAMKGQAVAQTTKGGRSGGSSTSPHSAGANFAESGRKGSGGSGGSGGKGATSDFGEPFKGTTSGASSLAARHSRYIDKKLDGKIMILIKHLFGPSNLIDLFAVLPFWVEAVGAGEESEGGALMVLRILRLTRIFRVFKLGKYNEVFTLFARVITQSMPALLLMLFFIWLGCCLFGTLIWFAEQGTWYPENHFELYKIGIIGRGAYLRITSDQETEDHQNLEESPFHSIVHSFWYVIVTITTVGYGDVFPTTALGKCIAVTSILNGIIVLAMPIGVVGANFSQEYYRVMEEKKKRARLKEETETLAAVEAEQDDALLLGEVMLDGENTDATELRRIDQARQLILMQAEDIDTMCAEKLGHERSTTALIALRHFVRKLLCSGAGGPDSSESVVTSPVMSPAILSELDVLTALMTDTIMACVSVERQTDFGLKEAFDMRHLWFLFVDACWQYVVAMCRVVKPQDPPEYFQMKAIIGRLALSESKKTMLTGSRTDSKSPAEAREGTAVSTDTEGGVLWENNSPSRDTQDCRDTLPGQVRSPSHLVE